jgi:hypothetical protein
MIFNPSFDQCHFLLDLILACRNFGQILNKKTLSSVRFGHFSSSMNIFLYRNTIQFQFLF